MVNVPEGSVNHALVRRDPPARPPRRARKAIERAATVAARVSGWPFGKPAPKPRKRGKWTTQVPGGRISTNAAGRRAGSSKADGELGARLGIHPTGDDVLGIPARPKYRPPGAP